MAFSNVMYLESYVESTNLLPAEIQRILNTIKSLDERVQELTEGMKRAVEACVALPPMAQKGSQNEEAIELTKRIQQDQQLLLQFADEKVQLAHQVYDLLGVHDEELDDILEQFEGEIQVNTEQFQPAWTDDFMEPAPKKLKGAAWELGYEISSLPEVQPAPKRQAASTANKGKRPREQEDSMPATSARKAAPPTAALGSVGINFGLEEAAYGAPVPEDPHMQHHHHHAAAHPHQQQQLHHPQQQQQQLHAQQQQQHHHMQHHLQQQHHHPHQQLLQQQHPHQAAAAAQQQLHQHQHQHQQAAPPPYVGFMTPLPPGLHHSAPEPQKPGKLLTPSDITPALRGRRAELFWPEDNLWYVIEVQQVNVAAHLAKIMYVTGETEELDLDEIIKQGHMSVIDDRLLM